MKGKEMSYQSNHCPETLETGHEPETGYAPDYSWSDAEISSVSEEDMTELERDLL
jgi:hypothetical protein